LLVCSLAVCLFGDVAHIQHMAIDFFGDSTLLFGSRRDLLGHALNAADAVGDVVQRNACIAGQLHALVGQAAAGFHALNGLQRARAQGCDQLLDVFG